MTTAEDIIEVLRSMQNAQQRSVLMRFFKTEKGEYGEGDKFIGLKVPQTRSIVRQVRLDVPLNEIEKLLYSEWHEARLCGFLLLVEEMKAALPKAKKPDNTDKAKRREQIARFYLQHATRANNWDLVDLSAGYILGEWLIHPASNGQLPTRSILDTLAQSRNLWEQRISIVATSRLIKEGQLDDTLRIALRLLSHKHDLIHKATGWMLREVGKKDIEVLRSFLSQHKDEMPRTALRYAIERMSAEERKCWMK